MACPKCENDVMTYGPIELVDEMTVHEVTCGCGFAGKQWEDRSGELFFTDQDDEEV